MIFPQTNPEDAALYLRFGPEYRMQTHAQRVGHLRDMLATRDYSPISAVKLAYSCQVNAIAYIEIAAFFPGTTTACLVGDPPEQDGFYRATGETTLFHPDSVDFEDQSAHIENVANDVAMRMLHSNINVAQALSVRPMSSGAAVITTGSVLDYFGFYNATGKMRGELHPLTARFAADCWAEVRTSYPALTQAIKEAVPA